MGDNLARRIDWSTTRSETGVVTAVEGRRIAVALARGVTWAERATSCLVMPEVDDFVLLCALETGAAYVLAVLEREPGAALCIAAEGDLAISVAKGSFRVTADGGVGLATPKELGLAAQGLRVVANEGHLALQQVSFLGRLIDLQVSRIRSVAQTVETLAERAVARVKNSYRFVEAVDIKRAGRIDHAAEHEFELRAENAVVTAQELVKVDGAQIHLG